MASAPVRTAPPLYRPGPFFPTNASPPSPAFTASILAGSLRTPLLSDPAVGWNPVRARCGDRPAFARAFVALCAPCPPSPSLPPPMEVPS